MSKKKRSSRNKAESEPGEVELADLTSEQLAAFLETNFSYAPVLEQTAPTTAAPVLEETASVETEPEETETIEIPLPPSDPAATKAWRLKLTFEEINQILTRATFGPLRLVPWGSNYTFLVALCDEETGLEYEVVYKPRRGEAPLWDFPNGTLYKREYGAYLVSKALGWNFIPPVIVRDGPHGPGTVQIFVDAYENLSYYQFREEHEHELKRIALFDLITNNADRKAGHCLLGADGMIWGIDHGLCFNTVTKLRTIIWDFSGQSVPQDIYNDLIELATDLARADALRGQLEELLERREVDLFFRRLEQLLEKPVFPGLASRRQIPWSMW